jgi:hypothetical protein
MNCHSEVTLRGVRRGWIYIETGIQQDKTRVVRWRNYGIHGNSVWFDCAWLDLKAKSESQEGDHYKITGIKNQTWECVDRKSTKEEQKDMVTNNSYHKWASNIWSFCV